MDADHVTEIGSTHKMCQDYALSGMINDHISFAIVSDGCSSSQDVDIGARLLCYAAKGFLLKQLMGEENIDSVVDSVECFETSLITSVLKKAQRALWEIDLDLYKNPVALDCTLLVAVADVNNAATFAQGDGGIVVQMSNKEAAFKHIDFLSGAPYYLSYELDANRDMGYMETYGREPVVVWNDQIKDGCVYRNIEARFDTLIPESLEQHTSRVHRNPLGITLVSDGVNSFQTKVSKKDWKNLTFEDILPSLTKFKNTNGEFVKRKLNAFKYNMNKAHEEWGHYDDLAMASIWLRKV